MKTFKIIPYHFTAVLLSILGLYTLWISLYSVACIALIVPLFTLLILSYSYIEYYIKKRDCLRKCFINEKTSLYRIISSSVLIILVFIIISIAMVFSIFTETIFFNVIVWSYLLIHTIILFVLYHYLNYKFNKVLNIKFRDLIVREWVNNIGATLLVPIFIYLFYNSITPSYIAETLIESISNATNSVGSDCFIIDFIIRLKAEFNASLFWLMASTTQAVDDQMKKIVFWIIYILLNGFAALGFNRLLVQIIYLTYQFTKDLHVKK